MISSIYIIDNIYNYNIYNNKTKSNFHKDDGVDNKRSSSKNNKENSNKAENDNSRSFQTNTSNNNKNTSKNQIYDKNSNDDLIKSAACVNEVLLSLHVCIFSCSTSISI